MFKKLRMLPMFAILSCGVLCSSVSAISNKCVKQSDVQQLVENKSSARFIAPDESVCQAWGELMNDVLAKLSFDLADQQENLESWLELRRGFHSVRETADRIAQKEEELADCKVQRFYVADVRRLFNTQWSSFYRGMLEVINRCCADYMNYIHCFDHLQNRNEIVLSLSRAKSNFIIFPHQVTNIGYQEFIEKVLVVIDVFHGTFFSTCVDENGHLIDNWPQIMHQKLVQLYFDYHINRNSTK